MPMCFPLLFCVFSQSIAANVLPRSIRHDEAISSNEQELCPYTIKDSHNQKYTLGYMGNVSHMCCHCNPGERLVELCEKGKPETTQCELCSSGTFISEYVHEQTTCRIDTRICPPGQVVIPSTPTSDSICVCMDGFKEKGEDKCRPYTKCPPGPGVASFGTPNTDTICNPCKHGFESPEYSSTQGCTLAKSVMNHVRNKHLFPNTPSIDDRSESILLETNSTDFGSLLKGYTGLNATNQTPGKRTIIMYESRKVFGLDATYTVKIFSFVLIVLFLWIVYEVHSKQVLKRKLKADRENAPPKLNAAFTPAERPASNPIEMSEENQTPVIKPVDAENKPLLNDASLNQPTSHETPKQSLNGRKPNSLKILPKVSSPPNTYCRKKSLELKKKLVTATKEELHSTEKIDKLSSLNNFISQSCIFSCPSAEQASPPLKAAPFLDPSSQPHQPNINPTSRSTQPNIDRSQLPVSTPSLTELRERVMYNLMIRLSTQIANRDEVKEFYRRILKYSNSRQFIDDLDTTCSNSSTSEWFIAVFEKLTDQGYNHFNPQIIYNHFISVNNRRLAEIVEEYSNPQTWNAQPMTYRETRIR